MTTSVPDSGLAKMTKVNDYNISFASQELIDMLDDIKTILNFGKYQWSVVSSTPTYSGRLGEHVWVVTTTSRVLYACASDQSATSWVVV